MIKLYVSVRLVKLMMDFQDFVKKSFNSIDGVNREWVELRFV